MWNFPALCLVADIGVHLSLPFIEKRISMNHSFFNSYIPSATIIFMAYSILVRLFGEFLEDPVFIFCWFYSVSCVYIFNMASSSIRSKACTLLALQKRDSDRRSSCSLRSR